MVPKSVNLVEDGMLRYLDPMEFEKLYLQSLANGLDQMVSESDTQSQNHNN